MTTTEDNSGVAAEYHETDAERVLEFRRENTKAVISQNLDGYAMVKVRDSEGNELERYYGFDMALDHVAELLGVTVNELPVPRDAADMGM